MSKLAFISRYNFILQIIRQQPYITKEALLNELEEKFNGYHERGVKINVGLSGKTIGTDIRELRINGFDIEFCTKNRGYIIHEDNMEETVFERMIKSIDIFNSLNLAQDIAPFIHFEKRKPNGTEHLSQLLSAIQNKNQITFTYQKYDEEVPRQRIAEPYALKEFKDRWYLMAKDGEIIKNFGLDRLSKLAITGEVFEMTTPYNIAASFHHYFGIDTEGKDPQEIILLFEPHQGQFIKSLPLHHSQVVLEDDENGLRVKLNLCVTFDFFKELLSFGNKMKVIAPASLIDELKAELQKTLEKYG